MFEGSVEGINIVTNKCNKLGLRDSKLLCIPLGDMYGMPLGTYYGSNLVSSEFSTDGVADGNFEGLLLWF